MDSHSGHKSIRWAPHLRMPSFDGHRSGVNAARPKTVSNKSTARSETHGTHSPSRDTTPGYSSIDEHLIGHPTEETESNVQRGAKEVPQVTRLSESTPSVRSTAPSTDTGSYHHTDTASTSPPTSIFEHPDLDGDSRTTDEPQMSLVPDIEVIEICQGTFVAIEKEPSNEDKLQWRVLSKRIHMAFAKTCKRYPNLSLQFKLAGTSADSLQPMIVFVCPEETQKKVRKFVKKNKWLSEAECGYKNIILDGNFLRIALDGEGEIDRGLFIRADMHAAETLCGKLGRLEGTLDSTGGSSRFTIGGVLVVNDIPCCLTAGHVLFDGPIISEMESSDEEDETDKEEAPRSPTRTRHSPTQSNISSELMDDMSFEADVVDSQSPEETKIGRLLTTSNWKRGILASNEDWSLIQLDDIQSTDDCIVNRFQDPGTEVQESLKMTVDKLALTEAEITGAEVIILAGCSGSQKGRLNTTAVQLYLDNATFEAREIVTQQSLKMGDSGSWVVQGSKLIGHVFAVQSGTPWSYMIPIGQVIEDIQKSLLTCSIELPTSAIQEKASLICPRARRTHASLAAFGVFTCPSCKQDLRFLVHPPDKGVRPEGTNAEGQVLLGDGEGEDSHSSLTESNGSSDESDHSIRASTVPTSYIPSSIGGTYASPDKYDTQYIPLSGNFEYRTEYSPPAQIVLRPRRKVPYVVLRAVLDEIAPVNFALERLIETNPNILLDLGNPVNYNVRTTEIVLITPALNEAFRHVVGWDPRIDQRSRQIRLIEPYAVLIHHLPQFVAYASKLRDAKSDEKANSAGPRLGVHSAPAEPQLQAQYEGIEALISFTQHFIDAADIATEFSRHERSACTFINLWLLFHPGMTVYARDDSSGRLSAFIVSALDTDISIIRSSYGNKMPYLIHLWRLNDDGRYVDRQWCSVEIDHFDGEQDITALNVFPCSYLDKADGGETRRKLEEQGRRWYRLLRGGAAYYRGKMPRNPDEDYEGVVAVDRGIIRNGKLHLDDKRLLPFNGETDDVHERRQNLQRLENVENRSSSVPWSSYRRLDPEELEDLELPGEPAEGKGHRYLLCAPYLPAFLMNKKRWDCVDVKYCSELQMDRSAFDHLWLPSSSKDIVRGLVQDFRQTIASAPQESERKGRSRNLVILLQGSTGTGKTFTAECLAETEGKVLMKIHPGEIGTDAERARDLLLIWLEEAELIDAIVLVPSADLYLEQVSTAYSEKSDVFSVFWSCLETYRGIIILTASRAVVPSELAMSRISLPIYYPPLNRDTRPQIGNQILRRLEKSRSFQMDTRAQELWEATLRQEELNGHEIIRILQNATAMARSRYRIDGEESPSCILHGKDLSAAINSMRVFKEHMEVSFRSELPQGREQHGPRGFRPAQFQYQVPTPAESYYGASPRAPVQYSPQYDH